MKWKPSLNPIQDRVFRCMAPHVLSYGERGSGKTIGALHKLVRHCVMNKNALALVIMKEVGQATEGGAWSKLNIEILPQWKNGNYDRKKRKFVDRGCGIEFTLPRLDASDKKSYVMISNRFGGWSMVKLISLNHGDHVEDKVKGKEASHILVDEAQTTESVTYFTGITQQVGRRPDIDEPQQLVYCANPKGPSHWLYEAAFCHERDEEGKLLECAIDEESGHPIKSDGKPVKEWAIFHVPVSENAHNLQPGYWERILLACKNDPIEHARMVEGVWVDKPEGEAIFKDAWNDKIHIRGDWLKSVGLMPVPKHLFILGWDPGAAHTSITMMQFITTEKKLHWLVFDEFNCVGKYMPYNRLVPKLIDRLIYWEHACREFYDEPVEFTFRHISDTSAFNQFRAKDGSFDAQDIEDISKEYVASKNLDSRFVIRMRPCPKGPNSVEARVRITTDVLMEESILISACCPGTRDMFNGLEADKESRMKPKRSRHVHSFDSLSYPLLYYNSGAGRGVTSVREEKPVTLGVFKI